MYAFARTVDEINEIRGRHKFSAPREKKRVFGVNYRFVFFFVIADVTASISSKSQPATVHFKPNVNGFAPIATAEIDRRTIARPRGRRIDRRGRPQRSTDRCRADRNRKPKSLPAGRSSARVITYADVHVRRRVPRATPPPTAAI